MIDTIIIVFYYFNSRCYSIARKKKNAKEAETMKKLEKFLEEYFEICAHK